MTDTTVDQFLLNSLTPEKANERNQVQRQRCEEDGWTFIGISQLDTIVSDEAYSYVAMPHYIGTLVMDTHGRDLNISNTAVNLYRKAVSTVKVFIATEWTLQHGIVIISPHETLDGAKEAYLSRHPDNRDTEWVERGIVVDGLPHTFSCMPDAYEGGIVYECEVQP